jgi:hypothetical protein
VLADGTSFAFSNFPTTELAGDSDEIAAGTLTLEAAAPATPAPGVFYASSTPPALGIRNGQVLIVDAGGIVPDNYNAAPGSKLVVEDGGIVGDHLDAVGADINVTGGHIGIRADAASGTTVNVSDGHIDNQFELWSDSRLNLAGGTVDHDFYAHSGSETNFSGGQLGVIWLEAGSVINVFGRDFTLNNEPIAEISSDEPYTLTSRSGNLQGLLVDDTPVNIGLSSSPRFPRPMDGTIVLHLVPADYLVGDFNIDGSVNAADYTTWRNMLGQTVTPGSGADANFDGRIDRGDYYLWKRDFGNAVSGLGAEFDERFPVSVPEPAGVMLGVMGLLAGIKRRRCRAGKRPLP